MERPTQTAKFNTRSGQYQTHAARATPILFDLDGTLIDSAYEHVIAWREALEDDGVSIPNVRIHRCVGMSGRLMLRVLFKEINRTIDDSRIDRLEKSHKRAFRRKLPSLLPLPGASDLLKYLSKIDIPWAIATGGDKQTVLSMIKRLRIPSSAPVITGDDVERAKPNPDVFLAAANRLGFALSDCMIVGDSIWDLLAAGRAKSLGIGLLSGGYSKEELSHAGAYRIYKGPADLLAHAAEVGISPE